MKFHRVKKILVIKLRHIGDVLLTVPALRALRAHFPEAHISVLVNSGTEDVLTGNTFIDEIITFDRSIKHLSQFKRFTRETSFLKSIKEKGFDMTVDLTGGDRAAILSFVSNARYRLGWKPKSGFIGKKYFYTHCYRPDWKKHMVLQNLDIISQSGIKTENLSVNLFIPENTRTFIESIFKENNILPNPSPGREKGKRFKVVHVHPTSRWLFKCWRDEYVAELIVWLVQQGRNVVVTSSPDKKEMDKARRILSLVGKSAPRVPPLPKTEMGKVIDLCGRTTIKQLAAISEASELFFGVDSAPMHIAAAVGTPVVALFGPSGAFNWGPWNNGQESEVGIRSIGSQKSKIDNLYLYPEQNGVQTSGMHTVIQRDWSCIPCGKDGCNGTKVSKCLEDIKPGEVKQVLSKKLKTIKR